MGRCTIIIFISYLSYMCTCLYFSFCKSAMSFWNWSTARCRLTAESGASNKAKTQLLRTELGFSTLTICRTYVLWVSSDTYCWLSLGQFIMLVRPGNTTVCCTHIRLLPCEYRAIPFAGYPLVHYCLLYTHTSIALWVSSDTYIRLLPVVFRHSCVGLLVIYVCVACAGQCFLDAFSFVHISNHTCHHTIHLCCHPQVGWAVWEWCHHHQFCRQSLQHIPSRLDPLRPRPTLTWCCQHLSYRHQEFHLHQ